MNNNTIKNNNNNTTTNITDAVIILVRMRADLLWEKYEVASSAIIVNTTELLLLRLWLVPLPLMMFAPAFRHTFGTSSARQLVASMQHMTTAAKCRYSLADCVGMHATQ